MSTALGQNRVIRRAIATVCLSGTLEDKLDAVGAAGFDGVEIFENDLIATSSTPAEVQKRCADLGLSIDLYQPFRDFDTMAPDRLTANLRRADHKFSVMDELGTDMMLVCSSVGADAVDDPGLLADQLHMLAERASRRGIKIAYEALAWGRYVNTWGQSWEVVRRGDHPALGLCLDSFHVLSRTPEPDAISAIADLPGEKIFFLQLADAPLMSMDVLQWSRHHRLFPGQGEFDLPLFVDHVLTAGYAGPLSLEVFNDVFRQSDPVHTAVDALRSLLVLEESVARRSPPKAVAFGLTCPPAVPTLSGHAFVELTADARSAAELASALRSFGFTETVSGRSSDIQLWQQGDARIVLNAPGKATGAEITSLGVDSDSPEQLAARAAAFLAAALPADDSGPAVTAPDGTTLRFCDSAGHKTWTSQFDKAAEDVDCGTGLTRIDHVALTQPFDYFDEAALFYRAVLGLAPATDTEFAAPFRARSWPGGQRSVRTIPDSAAAHTSQSRGMGPGSAGPPTRRLRDVRHLRDHPRIEGARSADAQGVEQLLRRPRCAVRVGPRSDRCHARVRDSLRPRGRRRVLSPLYARAGFAGVLRGGPAGRLVLVLRVGERGRPDDSAARRTNAPTQLSNN